MQELARDVDRRRVEIAVRIAELEETEQRRRGGTKALRLQ
jgi:hypothetical protein